MSKAPKPINLAEIENRAHQCVRLGIGLLLEPDDIVRMVAALRDFPRDWSVDVFDRHDIIDDERKP